MTTPSPGPALAMLDLADIPHGLLALDALAKEAEVSVVAAGTVEGGRYYVLFGGEVEPVERALLRAESVVRAALVDSVLLPYAEERILPAIAGAAVRWPAPGDTAGVLQHPTPPTLLRAVDAALKGALVDLVQLRMGDGLGGKGIATLWGETADVEAAVELATDASAAGAAGLTCVVIRNADPAVTAAMQPHSRFFKEFRG